MLRTEYSSQSQSICQFIFGKLIQINLFSKSQTFDKKPATLVALVLLSAYLLQNSYAVTQVKGAWLNQWHGERYDGTSTRTEPLQSKKIKIEL